MGKTEFLELSKKYNTLFMHTTEEEFVALCEACDKEEDVLRYWEKEIDNVNNGFANMGSQFVQAFTTSFYDTNSILDFAKKYNEFYHCKDDVEYERD